MEVRDLTLNLARRLVTIQRRSPVTDGQGGETLALGAIGTERARISRVKTAERSAGNQMGVNVTHRATIRAGADTQRGDVWVKGSTSYEVLNTYPSDGIRGDITVELEEIQRGV